MSAHLVIAASSAALSTTGLVTYLQGLFGPLFLGIVGIVAIFFLFTREVARQLHAFLQFWQGAAVLLQNVSGLEQFLKRLLVEHRLVWFIAHNFRVAVRQNLHLILVQS